MKKQLLTILAVSFSGIAIAQVGINNTTPTATLDITAKTPAGTTSSTNEGLLIPRVDRARVNSITSPVTSTMVYVSDISTGNTSGASANIDAVGFYYFNGTAWTKMGSGAGSAAVTADNGITQTAGNLQLGGDLTKPTVVSALTATNNLAFTGTGANAFSVDGTTLSVDAANHRLGLGTTTPNSRIQIFGTGGSDDDMNISSVSAANNSGLIRFGKYEGTSATPTALTSGSNLGIIGFSGYDGTALLNTARIVGVTDAAATTGSVPSAIAISTGSSTSGTERMRIASTGNIGIATNAPATTLDIAAKAATGTGTSVDGIMIPRVTRERAGSMTSVPTSTLVYVSEVTTTSASATAANIDAVGFYYFNGTAWQKLGGSSAATPYQNIRGNVITLSSSTNSYTVQATDYLIITTASSNGVAITLPTLTAADSGRQVLIYNLNASGGANSFPGKEANTFTTGNLNRTTSFIWTGSTWLATSAT